MNLFGKFCVALFLMPAVLSYAQITPVNTVYISQEVCASENFIDLSGLLPDNAIMGGSWSPVTSGGTGIFDPDADPAGVYTYTATDGVGTYSVEITITIVDPPVSTHAATTLCSNAGPVDLATFINNASGTGTWLPGLSSGTGVFNPAADPPGIYSYVVSGPCGTIVSEVYVSVIDTPDPGTDSIISVCAGNNSVNLFDVLGGNPDPGGFWTPSLHSGGSEFNPQRDLEGTYTYTVGNDECGYTASAVTVSIDRAPDAGSDAAVELCMNSGTINLFSLLGNDPDTGGTWFPALNSNSGWFDPLSDPAGVYTYRVSNGSCATSEAKVTVNLINTGQEPRLQLSVTGSLNYNMIRVEILEAYKYHYSLDNATYQSSNIFENLEGGKYTVYIREINGCGFYTRDVVILGGPDFFTPNGDGINDFWNLQISNIGYTVNIYDRYGRPIESFNDASVGWDGNFKGSPLPSADYWFLVNFEDGSVKNGHFTLLR